ncbi:MAG: hypothetical protein ABEJ68_11235 [Halobacteriaceae archaeon]
MLDALQAHNVIPAHQNMQDFSGYLDLASSQGYEVGEDLHVMQNVNTVQLV